MALSPVSRQLYKSLLHTATVYDAQPFLKASLQRSTGGVDFADPRVAVEDKLLGHRRAILYRPHVQFTEVLRTFARRPVAVERPRPPDWPSSKSTPHEHVHAPSVLSEKDLQSLGFHFLRELSRHRQETETKAADQSHRSRVIEKQLAEWTRAFPGVVELRDQFTPELGSCLVAHPYMLRDTMMWQKVILLTERSADGGWHGLFLNAPSMSTNTSEPSRGFEPWKDFSDLDERVRQILTNLPKQPDVEASKVHVPSPGYPSEQAKDRISALRTLNDLGTATMFGGPVSLRGCMVMVRNAPAVEWTFPESTQVLKLPVHSKAVSAAKPQGGGNGATVEESAAETSSHGDVHVGGLPLIELVSKELSSRRRPLAREELASAVRLYHAECSWYPKQLEREMAQGTWFHARLPADFIFSPICLSERTCNDFWRFVMYKMGGEYRQLAHF